MSETRTYWLSFCDGNLPQGQQFLGAVVVDVDRAAADEALAARPAMGDPVEGPWLVAAIRAAWQAGVNPGGEVASVRIDGNPQAALYPRLTLLSRSDIEALEPTVPGL